MLLNAYSVVVTFLVVCTSAAEARSAAEVHTFKKQNPCPITGKAGRCPGYEIDHIIPLCAGGADEPHNMQWLPRDAHAEKTQDDVRWCRALRKGKGAEAPIPIQR